MSLLFYFLANTNMRPIKFRAWDNSEKEMVHWASLLYDPDNWLEELLE